MGGLAAMNSLNRVLDKHGEELRQELLDQVSGSVYVEDVALTPQQYEISVTWKLTDETWIEGRPFDIDELAERFPDCNVAY